MYFLFLACFAASFVAMWRWRIVPRLTWTDVGQTSQCMSLVRPSSFSSFFQPPLIFGG